MKRCVFALCAGLLVLGMSPQPVLGSSVPDQSNTGPGELWGPGGGMLAQTFTVGIAGTLTEVDLHLDETPAAAVLLEIEGFDRRTGQPSGTVLAQASTLVGHSAWYEFDFAKPPSALAGAHLAIVFAMDAHVAAFGSFNNAYPAGDAFEGNGTTWMSAPAGTDLDFKTYMEPAAPTPAPTAKPTLAPTPPPPATSTPTAAPTTAASLASAAMTTPTLASPTASSGATEPAASGTPANSATPAPGPGSGSSGSTDWLVPILIGLIVVLVGVVAFMLGKQRPKS